MTPRLSLLMFVESIVDYEVGDLVEVNGRRGQVVDTYTSPPSLLVWWTQREQSACADVSAMASDVG